MDDDIMDRIEDLLYTGLTEKETMDICNIDSSESIETYTFSINNGIDDLSAEIICEYNDETGDVFCDIESLYLNGNDITHMVYKVPDLEEELLQIFLNQ